MKPKPKDISFHYTNEQMVKDLMAIIPFKEGDTALDAGSGKNKVWQKNCPVECMECEIEDGTDFMDWTLKTDWVIGNPPFHESWKFTEKALSLAEKGVAFLVNNTGLNSQFTPRRLQITKDAGFEITHIKVVADKRWFGRYYFLIYEKKPGFVSWERKTY
jgi:hypothetical protein